MIVIDKDSDGNVQVTEDGVTETLFPNIDETGGGGSVDPADIAAAVEDYMEEHPITAADVGAIAAPSSPSSGQFLQWNGTAWVAASLPTYNGGVS